MLIFNPTFAGWHKKQKKLYMPVELATDDVTVSSHARGFLNVSGQSTKLTQELADMIPLQYTGVTGTDGRQIFNGFVVIDQNKRIYTVDYNRGFAAYFLYPVDEPDEFMAFYPGIQLQVLGQKFDGVDYKNFKPAK